MRIFIASIVAGVFAAAAAAAELPPPPLPHAMGRPQPHPMPAPKHTIFHGRPKSASPWTALANPRSFNPGAMLQLTDGTVMVQSQGASNSGSGDWWRLTPDDTGSYVNGTWTQLASLPADYAPLYFASAMLPDGRVIIEGGEYNLGAEVWTNLGAIYDPVANTWTEVSPPTGEEWVRIGDGPSTVLANGTFMLGASGYSGTTAQALLAESTLSWTSTGTGKADGNGEEGWSLLPNGDVLTVDTTNTTAPQNTEIFSTTTGSWTSAGNTPAALVDSVGEIGPQVLRPTGSVFAVGATGHTAIYTTGTGLWTAGPDLPVIGGHKYQSADGPSAVLPSGRVLVDASPGVYQTPAHFFVFTGSSFVQVADPPNASRQSSYDGFMMVLPTGQILFNDRIGDLEVYTDDRPAKSNWLPVITAVPTIMSRGATHTVSGEQLDGLTQGAAYGDDYQSATNFPLVRLTMTATGHVFYARTTGISRMSVTPHARSSAKFTIPATMEKGAATLAVVANGIASSGVAVTIK